jgi:hypothetical protein
VAAYVLDKGFNSQQGQRFSSSSSCPQQLWAYPTSCPMSNWWQVGGLSWVINRPDCEDDMFCSSVQATFYANLYFCMLQDEERVTRRFLNAAERGITVRKASLTCKDLVRHLSESGPIILLTNASLLCCDICKVNRLASELRGCLPWGTAYTGMYNEKLPLAPSDILSCILKSYTY